MDYDVAAVSLNSPPALAPLDTYTPAVEVKNNGIYSAVATGWLSIYKAGVRVFYTTIESAAIAPGATSLATAADDWTPDTEGDYTIFGYVTTPLDQVEPNNNLSPVVVTISGAPPPPPPTVPAHAPQHEHGGSDEVSVEGLAGVLADEQKAEAHVASHQVGGDDQLNIDGLSGQAAQAQTPDVHGNEAHNPDMATAGELSTHANGTSVHTAATNLANRETTGAREGLVPQAQLAAATLEPDPDQSVDLFGLRHDDKYGPTEPKRHAAAHEAGGLDEVAMPGVLTGIERAITCTPAGGQATIVSADLDAAQVKPGTVINFHCIGSATTPIGPPPTLRFLLYYFDGAVTTEIARADFVTAQGTTYDLHITGSIGLKTLLEVVGLLHGEINNIAAPGGEIHGQGGAAGGFLASAVDSSFYLAVTWVGGGVGTTATIDNATALGVVRP